MAPTATKPMKPSLIKILWLVLFALVLAPRFALFQAPLEHLVTVLPDDAFYYFETAQRIVQGEGLTFDGEDLADGFQPLWMLILLPFAWLPKLAFLKAGIALGTAFHLLSIAGLGRFVFLVSGVHGAALLAGTIYATNKWAMFSSVNGLETALTSALFCVCLVLAAQHMRRPKPERETLQKAGALGVALALLFLARTDQVFYAAALLASMVLLVEKRISWVLRVAIAGLSLALPWFLWHWWLSGSMLPSSGRAQPLIMRTLADLAGPAAEHRGWISFRGFFDGRVFDFTGFNRYLLIPLGGLGVASTVVRWPKLSGLRRWATGLLALLFVAGVALAFVHTYIRWYPRTWYFDQFILLVAAFLALAAVDFSDTTKALIQRLGLPQKLGRTALAGAILLALVPLGRSAWSGWQGISGGVYRHQDKTLKTAQWIEANLPGATIASWNAGITAFFLDQPVINLDGAISASTMPYLEQKNLTALLCERQVRYVVDHEKEIKRFQAFLPGYASYAHTPHSTPLFKDQGYVVQEISETLWANGCAGQETWQDRRPTDH